MQSCDYLIIGGGLAAYSAAKKIRRAEPKARTVMVSRDDVPPYDLPPLSKEFLRGERTEAELRYASLDEGADAVEIRLSTSVEELNVNSRTATTGDGSKIEFRKALLATGALPIRLGIPGCDLQNVFYLRSIADARAIAAAAQPGMRAAIIGGGFIGVEIAASLSQMGVAATVIEATNRIWPRFADPHFAEAIRAHCAGRGVTFRLGETVVSMEGDAAVRSVSTSAGSRLECDLVCVGIGVRPNVALAQAAGLDVADGILVDHHMRTSCPDVFAVGDAAAYPDPIKGKVTRAEHWGHAEYSGQIAGMNMTGSNVRYDFMNYVWSDIFDLHIESAGHLDEYDNVVIRGDVGQSTFTSLYLREGKLVAYSAVNGEQRDFVALRKLIRDRRPLGASLHRLRDPTVRVREVV